MIDPRLAAAIAGRYRDLQGLRQVVAGVLLLGLSIWTMFFPITLQEMRRTGGPSTLGLVLLLVLLLGLIPMAIAIRKVSGWYDRHYGRVEVTRHQRRLFAVVGGVGAAAFLVPFEIEILVMNSGGTLPVNVILLFLSLAVFGYWLYLGRSPHHYLVIGAAGLALTALSVAGIPPYGFVWHLREALLFAALATIVGGLIDHGTLTRAFSVRGGGAGES